MSVEIVHERPKEDWFLGLIDLRTLFSIAGPGLAVSLGFLDPGNLESDLQSGAYTGYYLVWILAWSTLIGLFLQILAARLGVVTGKNLAQHCSEHYSKKTSLFLWFMAQTAIIGADIQQIVGSAIAFNILFDLPLWIGSLLTAGNAFGLLYLSNKFGTRKLELLFSTLILTMLICFAATLMASGFSVEKTTLGLIIPTVPSYGIMQAVGTVGAVVMPHNIFLHSALVQSRTIDRTDSKYVVEANKYFGIESGLSLFLAFIINSCVVLTFAVAFFDSSCAELDGGPFAKLENECKEIGLADSGKALEKSLGSSARYVWAIGLLAAGQASTMTGTLAGQVVFDGFLNLDISIWRRMMISRLCALVPALFVALGTTHSSGVADRAGEILNVLQSVQLPFALIPVLRFTSDPRIMGESFVNGPGRRIIGLLLAALILVVNFALVGIELFDWAKDSIPSIIFVCICGIGYLSIVLWISWRSTNARTPFSSQTEHENTMNSPLLVPDS